MPENVFGLPAKEIAKDVWLLDDLDFDYEKAQAESELLSAAEKALGLWPESSEFDESGSGTLLVGDCGGHLLPPVYQVTNAVLTVVDGASNAVHDLFMLHEISGSNTWTFVARGTNGQTVFVVTNVPADQNFFTVCCTNDTDCDTLSDCWEALMYHTDSNDPDTDYDGRSDYEELVEGTDPLNPASFTPVRLGYFRFNDTNWLGTRGQVPLAASNLHLADAWITRAVEVNTNGALLKYKDVECGGAANINLRSGTVRFWFKSLWNSGTGPGAAGKLIEVGSKGASETNGWWSLFFNSTGNTLILASQTNSMAETTNLTAAVSFASNNWYQIVLTYTNGAFALYTNGVLCATNTGTLQYPGLAQRQTGFNVGAGADGNNQVKGVIEDLDTANYPLCEELPKNPTSG